MPTQQPSKRQERLNTSLTQSEAGKYIKSPGAGLLNARQLQGIANHQYSAAGRSFLEGTFQVYWNWLVKYFPQWLAPNTITLTGMLVNIATSLIIFYYSPNAKEEIPAWALITAALGIFFYQTMDALDGKQARRTGSSSPLGELFDHGCDSLTTAFVTISMCCVVKLGTHPDVMLFCCLLASFIFYCAHWQTYVSGTMHFGIVDVTEAQISMISVKLLSAIVGTNFWDTPMPVFGMPWKMLPVVCITVGAVFTSYWNFNVIFTGGVGKNGATIANTSVLFPVIPIMIVIVPALYIGQKSSGVIENNMCLYTVLFGVVAAKVTNRLVVAHMTKSEMQMLDTALWGPFVIFVNQYFGYIFDEATLLWISLIYCTGDLLRYSTLVCGQICRHLDIHCFSIRAPSPARETTRRITRSLPQNGRPTDSRRK